MWLVFEKGVEIPKKGREKLQKYSSVRLHVDMRLVPDRLINKFANVPPLDIQLGDIFLIPFGAGEAGFLINEIYRNSHDRILVKGCRWHLINSPEQKRWWNSNNMLQEHPNAWWQNLRFPPNRLEEVKAPLSEEASLYLQGKRYE